MIALLLVSHSYQVAQGVRQLAAQMAPPELSILAVGGLPEGDGYVLGCDAAAIAAALETVWTPAGVLILADLGSSILSAETALELVPPHMAETCWISNAPLVEGGIIAAVEAGLGHALADVNRAAEAAAHLIKINRACGP
ncbi:MAG: dihydroxyacetone kinase phosphoryl donor subunit DhaM [Litorilinea sp.]